VLRAFEVELTGKPGIRFARSNDPEGDCGVAAAFQFDSEEQARKFAAFPGVGGWLPIDTGRHVYTNWEPVLEKRAGSHPALNPFNMPQNRNLRTDYSADMCPNTLDICSRSVFVSLSPDWTETQIMERIEACKNAGEAL